jgi:ribosomal protein L29
MDLLKLTTEEIRGLDLSKSKEVEKEIRREQALLRMDVYGTGNASKKKSLKRSLARILTVRNEK